MGLMLGREITPGRSISSGLGVKGHSSSDQGLAYSPVTGPDSRSPSPVCFCSFLSSRNVPKTNP